MTATAKPQRELFEAAVVERLKESGFLEIQIRTECLGRCDDGYQDEVINAGWHYWNAAILCADEIREQKLATVAAPDNGTAMEDEDRTPMPAGLDHVLWKKADEVHHAMALVARNQECVKIIYAALSTDAEPVKTPFEVASKHIPEARASLLSRAIRQGLNDYGWKNFGMLPEVLMGYIVDAERAEAAVHAEPVKTAPAVAVKALEVPEIAGWQPPQACDGKEQLAFEAWAVSQRYDMHEHPLHYIFMDPRTSAARKGWSAALQYVRDQFPASSNPKRGGAE